MNCDLCGGPGPVEEFGLEDGDVALCKTCFNKASGKPEACQPKNVPLAMALSVYGATIKELGWEAGEPLIAKYAEKFMNFREMAWAVGIVLRAEEILEA